MRCSALCTLNQGPAVDQRGIGTEPPLLICDQSFAPSTPFRLETVCIRQLMTITKVNASMVSRGANIFVLTFRVYVKQKVSVCVRCV